jgi:TDG/mug DNA glycosylase family protein
MTALATLPDLLLPGLDVVFVGINPGERSAELGHYYAHPGNGFWPALSNSLLVSTPVVAEDDRSLAASARIGFTDVVKRVITDSTQVTTEELRASGPDFRARIAEASPRAVCLTSSRAFDVLCPKIRASGSWGRQPVTLEGSSVWVMPSTSGRAIRHRAEVHRVFEELATDLGRVSSGAAS